MNATVEVAIPCFNEARTVAKVVHDFRRVLPEARIVVYDNCSTDGTGEIARGAGAEVRKVNRPGKGFAVQAIFEQSRGDLVLMVDGDDTYEAEDARRLLEPLLNGDADMTVGSRLEQAGDGAFRQFHRLGNRFLAGLLNSIFKASFRDILSGYRGFSRYFLENVPLITSGFETETELVLQSLELGFTVREVPVRYRSRPAGSASKLRTFRDGWHIVMTMLILLRDHRPLLVFGSAGSLVGLAGAGAWILGVTHYPELRPAGVALATLAVVVFLAGLILNTVNTRFREVQSLLRRPKVGTRYPSIPRGRPEVEEPEPVYQER